MKKSIAIIAVILGGLSVQQAMAQFSISINIGKQQPVYRQPVRTPASFYYLPEVDCYYDLGRKQYVYNNNGSWRYAQQLPSRYNNFDLRNARKVVVNDNAPYSHHNDYKNKYGANQGRNNQPAYNYGGNDKRYANNNGRNKDRKQDWKNDRRRGK